MADYAAQPGTRVLWYLKRRVTQVRCVVLPQDMVVEVHIVHGPDVVVTV